ncbi:MAG: S8 family serine peptidase [Anaerolineae bacterium]|jgi:subtilisin family serine protease
MRRPSSGITTTRFVSIILLVVILCAVMLAPSGSAASPAHTAAPGSASSRGNLSTRIEPQLGEQIRADGSGGYMIYFHDQPDLSAAHTLGWAEREQFVTQRLQHVADRSQADVRAYLDARGVTYKAFWIANVIVVESSDLETLQGVASFSGVASLRASPQIVLHQPESVSDVAPGDVSLHSGIEPNLLRVRADRVWEMGYRGQGIVVGSIDSGVHYTHEALKTQYRGYLGSGVYSHDYNWWDPYGIYRWAPGDDHGHGTHTMGIIVGRDGGGYTIGMAPEATWIACRGFSDDSAGVGPLLECAEFMAAPWDLNGQNPDPGRRPHVVNNSWGDCARTYDDWFQDVVDHWVAAGIYPVFSAGNASTCSHPSPPPCNTVGNPARYGNVTAVGSTGTANGAYASFSNRGPTDVNDPLNPMGYPDIKPQVVAPGININSASNRSNVAYQEMTGTSMSAPHVAGLVALIWSAAHCLARDYVATETLIMQTANPVTAGLPAETCSGEAPGGVPNQSTGWGEIDALRAVNAAIAMPPCPWVRLPIVFRQHPGR